MRLFYKKYGDVGNPVIVVVHGLLGLSDNWDYFGKHFAELGYHVIIPDMRNHGQSPKMETFNYSVMASDVMKVLKDENVTRCSVIGHSMGGKIAMMLAFRHPDMVERLEILDISPRQFDYPLQHVDFIDAMSHVDLKKVTRRSDVEDELSKRNYEKRIVLFLLKNLSYSREKGFRWKPYLKAINRNIEEIGKGFDPSLHYSGKTLIIKGGKSDYIIEEKDKPYFECHFSDYKIVTLPDSGHWIHVDDPVGFMKTTESFFMSNK